jgi:hypothetical protein
MKIGSCVRLSTTDAYALMASLAAAMMRIVSTSCEVPAISGKNAASGACWNEFAGMEMLFVLNVEPVRENSVSVAFMGAAPRFTRPTFVRKLPFAAMPVM